MVTPENASTNVPSPFQSGSLPRPRPVPKPRNRPTVPPPPQPQSVTSDTSDTIDIWGATYKTMGELPLIAKLSIPIALNMDGKTCSHVYSGGNIYNF